MRGEPARAVVTALAEELAAAPRLDRERFRARRESGEGADGAEGEGAVPSDSPRADRAAPRGPSSIWRVPAIDRGADLPRDAGLPKILGNRERAAAFVDALKLQQ